MFIWACGPTEHFPSEEMLLGHVNIKMGGLTEENGMYYLFDLDGYKVCLSN